MSCACAAGPYVAHETDEAPLVENCPKCAALPSEPCVCHGRAAEPHYARTQVACLRYARDGWLPGVGEPVTFGGEVAPSRGLFEGYDERGRAVVRQGEKRHAFDVLEILGPWREGEGPTIIRRMAKDEEQPKRGPGRPREVDDEGPARNLVVRVGAKHEAELEALAKEHGSASAGIRHLLEQSATRRARRA